jgi:TRAP-type mannitol/chloroaromatic compound transport system substrate-binding protein
MQRQVKRWVRIVTRFATAVAGLTVALVPQARAETLKLLSSWAENDRPSYVNALIFQKHVKDVSEGKLTITINGPEVVPPFEQLRGNRDDFRVPHPQMVGVDIHSLRSAE